MDKDTVDYRDDTPFDSSKLQPISEISKGIRHKMFGKDTREAMAQQGESLIKLIQDTGGNQSAEVKAARGSHELLGIREDAQDSEIYKKADKKELDNLSSRVDNLSSLGEGSTTGDAEILDVRVGDDGHTYAAAGTSVRTQFKNIKKDLSEVLGGKIKLQLTNQYVASSLNEDFEEGIVHNDDRYRLTQPIAVYAGDKLAIDALGTEGAAIISLWTSDGTFVKTIQIGNTYTLHYNFYAETDGYIRVCSDVELDSTLSVKRYLKVADSNISNSLRSQIPWQEMPIEFIQNAYVGSDKHEFFPNQLEVAGGPTGKIADNYSASELFFAKRGTLLTIESGISDHAYVLSEFSSDGIFIKGLLYGDMETTSWNYFIDHDSYLIVSNDTRVVPNPKISSKLNTDTDLNGKTFNIIGDSYVKNNKEPVESTWHYKMAQELNLVYNNYGINGNGLVSDKATGVPVINRLDTMTDTTDYMIVIGGKNDYNQQLPIAEFKIGLETIITKLISKYPNAKIGFFTPWSLGKDDDKTIKLVEYSNAIEEICEMYSIPCFNSSKESGIYVFDSEFRKRYMQADDDVSHLNAAGHDLFKNKATNFIKKL